MNWSSSKQLRELLFVKLGLPVVEKTPKGEPSTGSKALKAIADKHPIVPLLLEYRKLTKLITSYTESLIEKVAADGRVHPSFMQIGTETGRLSSESPNGQQIPKHTQEGKELRRAFVAGPGAFLLSFDYSQIELRVLAHYSQDVLLCRAFTEQLDVHKQTASEIFNIPIQDINDDQRHVAKAVNFGLVYGSTEYGLARNLGIPKETAKQYIDGYFAKYKGVYYWMRKQINNARRDGQVVTIMGKPRRILGLDSKDKYERAAAERQALNTTIQGSAADIMKSAMIQVHRLIATKKYPCKFVLQIHDDIVLECKNEMTDAMIKDIQSTIDNAIKLSVPLQTNMVRGQNLGEMI